jgi:hypothetical protein
VTHVVVGELRFAGRSGLSRDAVPAGSPVASCFALGALDSLGTLGAPVATVALLAVWARGPAFASRARQTLKAKMVRLGDSCTFLFRLWEPNKLN